MKRSNFLLISAILSFVFGAMMFFVPVFAAKFLDIAATPQTISVLRGMGGTHYWQRRYKFFLT